MTQPTPEFFARRAALYRLLSELESATVRAQEAAQEIERIKSDIQQLVETPLTS